MSRPLLICHAVDDQIVIDLVQKEIAACEQEKHSWIVQGFPRTKVQALALQKHQILPDKFVQLNTRQPNQLSRIKNKLIQVNQALYGPELDALAEHCYMEHCMQERGVFSVFGDYVSHFDCDVFSSQQEVQNELLKILKLRFKNDAPRTPPKIIILGPPGSGKTTQCETLANQFGLVKVSVHDLLNNEMRVNPKTAPIISQCIENGVDVPDHIINPLIEARLK